MSGKLILLPNLLDKEASKDEVLPKASQDFVASIEGLIAESMQGGLRFLKRFQMSSPPHHFPIALLNEHSKKGDWDFLLEPLLEGEVWGLVSDAGLPCIADPGANLVWRAHQKKIVVEAPLSATSSLMQALMLSGCQGQRFSFRGYIHRDELGREKELLKWQKESKKERSTQIFIEAPYRNQSCLKTCLNSLDPGTKFCVALGLSSPNQRVISLRVSDWKKKSHHLEKIPAVFLFESK